MLVSCLLLNVHIRVIEFDDKNDNRLSHVMFKKSIDPPPPPKTKLSRKKLEQDLLLVMQASLMVYPSLRRIESTLPSSV